MEEVNKTVFLKNTWPNDFFAEYHFTSKEEMKKSIDEGNFIEWAEFSGNVYGTR